jgi:hypothetical protein
MLLRHGQWAAAAARLAPLSARIETLWPAGHQQRYTHRLHLGALALAQDRPTAALAHFDTARSAMAGLVPVTYPPLINAECGRGVALARLGRRADARPLLAGACERYRTYGIHFAPLVRWAREEGARAGE